MWRWICSSCIFLLLSMCRMLHYLYCQVQQLATTSIKSLKVLICTTAAWLLPPFQHDNVTPSHSLSTNFTSNTFPPSTTVVLELYDEEPGEEYTCIASNSHAGNMSWFLRFIYPSLWAPNLQYYLVSTHHKKSCCHWVLPTTLQWVGVH